jgi:hypothetical protein
MSKIEHTSAKGEGAPRADSCWKEKVQRILDSLSASGPLRAEGPSVGETAPHTAPVDLLTLISESSTPSSPSCEILIIPRFFHKLTAYELPSPTGTSSPSDDDENEAARTLPVEDAQKFIDMTDEARFAFTHHHMSTDLNLPSARSVG